MKIIICGGGTAGHVTPGIAIAEYIKEKSSKSEILFIGRSGGEENLLTKRAGFNYTTLDVRGFKRSLSPKNITAVMKMLLSLAKSRKILKDFNPDVVIGTGGYVTWPVVKAAQCMKIPCMVHESNAFPGLTTRALAKGCDRVLLNYEKCKEHLKRQDNALTVGNPLRRDLMTCTRGDARKKLKILPSEIFILSFGGSGGADTMNKTILSLMRSYSLPNKRIKHLHATGRKYFSGIKEEFPELISNFQGCKIVPFINDMPTYMLASDIVISRAGAMTLSEISKTSVAPIIIPSPNVTDNHQYKNAKAYEDVGGGIVIEEKDLTEKRLKKAVDMLVTDKKAREKMAKSAHSLHVKDSTEMIFKEIERLTEKTF